MFNQIFSKKVIVPFFQFVGIIAIFTFIVFPGLTAADTIVNIFSAIIGFFTMLALFYFVTTWFQQDELTDEEIKSAFIKGLQKSNIKVNKASKWILLSLEDSFVREAIKAKLKELNHFSDSSFNSEIISLLLGI